MRQVARPVSCSHEGVSFVLRGHRSPYGGINPKTKLSTSQASRRNYQRASWRMRVWATSRLFLTSVLLKFPKSYESCSAFDKA
jgi:hypothetical protein